MNIAEYHCGHLEVVLLGRELGMNVEVLEEVGKQVNVSELGYMHHAMAGTLRVIRSVHGEHGHFDLVLRGDGHDAAKALRDEYRPPKRKKPPSYERTSYERTFDERTSSEGTNII